ncbi:MAG: hypothetical protein ACI31R_00975 [Bacilli bacterium]
MENNSIIKILNSDLSDEQKEALLGKVASNIIIEKQNKTSFEQKKEELIAKEREKAENTRKRLKEYEENSLKEETGRKRNEELENKIKALSEITNKNGEKIYSDLSDMSGYEIDRLYEIYFGFDKVNSEENKKSPKKDNINSNVDLKKQEKEKVDENLEETEEQELEDENEIVDEGDGSEITRNEKFKKLAKKALKIGAVIGAIGLIGGAIYHFVNTGDSSPIEEGIKNVADVMQNSASNIPTYDSVTDVGNVTEVFSSNQDAISNVNSMTPLDDYFQNEVLGYTTSDDQMINADSLGDVISAHNSGEDVTSIYVGNEDGIDGFVNKVYDQPLSDFLESNEGGRVR